VTRPILTRLLVATALTAGVWGAHAETRCVVNCFTWCDRDRDRDSNYCPPPRTAPVTPPSQHSNNDTTVAVTGILTSVVGAIIWNAINPPAPPPPSAPPPGSYPPDGRAPTQLQLSSPGAGGGGGGGGPGAGPGGGTPGGPAGPGGTRPVQALRNGCNLPPVGETRFVQTELVLDIPSSVSTQMLDDIAARHDMTRVQTTTIGLTGRTLHRWRIDNGTSVADMIRNVCTSPGDRVVAGAQPNYLYELAQTPQSQQTQQEPVNSAQYAPDKLKLIEAHRLANGNRVLVAVIDSEVDATHPDLVGAVTASFDAAAEQERPHPHGTGMAGAIAAHRTMLGTAPRVGLLTVRAFSATATSAEGTTFTILRGLDWAADEGARVVNMSFAGPSDPRLREALQKAYKKGIVLIAAAGNAGPNSPPLYPGADPNVIAVTATDTHDAVFAGANRGNYIAVAAPGVDVFAPAPAGTYQLTTGTSVAAAEVSGVAALLIERNPALTPAAVRKILMDTATRLGPKGRDYGAGLVNALEAVKAAQPHLGQ
jgi:Subtilase family